MYRRLFLSIMLTAGAAQAALAADIDYTKGVFMVNEDWYGHQNSTVNHLDPDNPDGEYWTYRVIQRENPGTQLGCTNQYGAIWHGRFYLIAKQEKDPAATITGGRITVADAKTMKVVKQLQKIDPSGASADGRGFVGVDAHKGYVSSSNGVWVLDLDRLEVLRQVEGTANPNGAGDGNNQNTGGSLYHGQCGSMVSAAGKIFVAHQSEGLLVVDPSVDKVVHTIPLSIVQEKAAIGSVVKALDGSLWVSVAKTKDGSGATLPYLVRVDPRTYATEIVDVASGIFPPSNSWYAWTPDTFCASETSNTLYWTGGPNSWFSSSRVYSMDVATREVRKIIDFTDDPDKWKIYGCSLRPHPITGELYMSLYHAFNDNTYITRRCTPQGEKIRDYAMIQNYWFPSLPVFPESSSTSIGSVEADGSAPQLLLADGSLRLHGLVGMTVQVFDASARCVLSAPVTSDDCSISLSALPSGIYIARAGSLSLKLAL